MNKENLEVALRFNKYINERNLLELGNLMTEDHSFISSSNTVESGKEHMIEAWREFFESYPDYRNIFEYTEVHEELVILVGYSTCSEESLDGPAIWTAKINDGLVSEWRVYDDTIEVRTKLGIK
ncbi:MAG: hypothetical protein GF411_08300 [Candidatus Lokiarchaeota archaeon]|nr:hypothetical protein [Candidatus Lokiarchaeota archaeon]